MLSVNSSLKILVCSLLVCSCVCMDSYAADDIKTVASTDEDMDETGRVAFVTVQDNGIVITWNATSLLYGALGGIALAGIAAAIAIPLALVFGLKKAFTDYDYDDYGSGYGNTGGGYGDSGHGNTGGSSYTNYAKRSLEVMSPIMNALYGAYQKYSNRDESSVQL